MTEETLALWQWDGRQRQENLDSQEQLTWRTQWGTSEKGPTLSVNKPEIVLWPPHMCSGMYMAHTHNMQAQTTYIPKGKSL